MRGKMLGALLCAAVFTGLTGTAHAGYAHVVPIADVGDQIQFDALPHEASDLRLQFSEDGRTVTFEDLANPITQGAPPTGGGAPCQIVSTHRARCTTANLWGVVVTTGRREARVTDLEGDAHGRPVSVSSGPLGDVIDLDDQAAVSVWDDGGANEITLGARCVCSPFDQRVTVGPGASQIDVRNGEFDYVTCMAVPPSAPVVGSSPSSYPGEYNLLDSVKADSQDHITSCQT